MYRKLGWVLALVMIMTPSALVSAADPVAEQPVLITSSGQSLEGYTAKVLAERAGLNVIYDPLATPDQLDGVKTIMISVGASVKGFGSAGISAESELARTRELLKAIDERGLYLIVLHIGGNDRRGPLSEPFVELVSPQADCLVVWKAGNQDGYFTRVASERGILLVELDQVYELPTAFKQLFGI